MSRSLLQPSLPFRVLHCPDVRNRLEKHAGPWMLGNDTVRKAREDNLGKFCNKLQDVVK